jgi:hypothetical protein
MAILVNIVTADEEEIDAVGESQHPVEEWSGVEVRDFDTAKIATLHSLLIYDDYEEAFSAYEPVYVAMGDGAVVIRFPDALAEKLATLEEDALDRVGEELVATEEFELSGWALEEVQAFLLQLADLARLAESQGQIMLAWMHPLRT